MTSSGNVLNNFSVLVSHWFSCALYEAKIHFFVFQVLVLSLARLVSSYLLRAYGPILWSFSECLVEKFSSWVVMGLSYTSEVRFDSSKVYYFYVL